MHDLDEDHGHENFEIGPDAIIEDIEGLEMFTLKSVGIDIGSSTSHLVFSQLTLRREGASLSGRFKVTERKVLFRSDIMLTPYLSGTLIDVDMGGGTTKFSLVENGVVTQTASINVGARLIAFDDADVVTRIEDAGRTLMKELGHSVELGRKVSKKQKEDFAAVMAQILFELIERGHSTPLAKQLMVTPPFRNYSVNQVDHIVFSGGVSEHVYDRDPTSYGDVGPILGKNMREYLKRLPKKEMVREPMEGIRATVIGAGEYTVQASGNTSYISNPKVLPIHGLKVVRASLRQGRPVREALKQALAKFDLTSFTSGLALSLSLDGQLDYKLVREVAEGVAAVCQD